MGYGYDATMLRCYDAASARTRVTVFNFDVKMVTLCCTVWTGAPHFNGVKKLTNIEKINIEKWVRQKYSHLHLGNLADAFIQSDLQKIHLSEEREKTIYCCRYSKDKCQALTIVRLTHSPYTIKITRIGHYTMLSTIFKCQDVQHTISAYIKSQESQSDCCFFMNNQKCNVLF